MGFPKEGELVCEDCGSFGGDMIIRNGVYCMDCFNLKFKKYVKRNFGDVMRKLSEE